MVDSNPSTSTALSLLFRPAGISVLTCVIALVVVGGVTASNLQRLTESDRSQRHSHQVIAQSEAILESLTDSQRGMRGYILSGRPEALALYDGAVTRLPLQLSTLATLEHDAGSQTSHLQTLQQSIMDVIGYSRRLLAEYRSFGVQGAASLESSGLGLEVMNRARHELQALLDAEKQQFDARSRNIELYSTQVQLLVSIGAALVLAVLAGAAITAWRQLLERRRAEAAASARLTAQRVAEADLEKNRQLLEKTIRLSEERFRLVIDGIKDYALFMLSPGGTVLSWNTGAQRLKGYAAAEILGHHFSCFYPPEDRARGHAQDELRIAEADGRYEEEGWRVRKDGSRFLANVVITAIRDNDGTLRGFAKATRDVTEARRLDRANREQAGILDLANDTIFVRDLDGRIIYWNRGAERLYGWNKQEAIGQITHALLTTRFPEPLETIMSDLLHAGQWQGELQHTRRDGAQIIVSSRWTLQPAGIDAPQRIIEMNHDVTLRKQMEATLLMQNQELQRAAHAKDRFLAKMSHELRTPLNAVIGFSELLVDGLPGPVNNEQREYLTDILTSARHLLQLINDILDLSKVQAGKMRLHPERFQFRSAVEEVCNMMQPLAQRRQLVLTRQVAPEVPEVVLDQQRVKQILYNLISNAIKFTAHGGSVSVQAQLNESGQLLIRVSDTGIGIQPENLRRLFREFEQLDDGAGRRYGGTGLGLALTRSLAELHGGSIEAHSTYGAGSTFVVTLPLAAQRSAA